MLKDIDIWDMVGAYPTCENCHSTQVVRDAWAEWSITSGEWSLKTVFDSFACDKCGEETKPIWKLDKALRKKRIAQMNDTLRQGQLKNATIVITQGVKALGEFFLAKVSREVAVYDEFSEDNDPHGEHDFGSLKIDGEKLFWKIDAYDLELKYHSPDAANPILTHRVLTIMLASEY